MPKEHVHTRAHILPPLSPYIICHLCFSLQIVGCMRGGGVYVCTRVRDRVVICMPFDVFYLFCCMLYCVCVCVCVCVYTFSKHRATTLRSNLQQFNRPGKDLHNIIVVIEFYTATGINNCWSSCGRGVSHIFQHCRTYK